MENSNKILHQILKELEELQLNHDQGKISFMDQDLIPIFQNLTKHLSPDEIELGLAIMHQGTSILSLKIEEIRNFILFVSQKDLIMRYLEQSSDLEQSSLLINYWAPPFLTFSLNSEFLFESFDSLVTNKPTRFPKPPRALLDQEIEKEVNDFEIEQETLQNELETFLISLESKLPLSFTEILTPFTDLDDYFRHFSFVLHLSQEGLLEYHPQTKTFHKGRKKNE